MPAALLNTEGQPLIFAKKEAGSFCAVQIPVRETTETTTCCEIPLPPRCHRPSTSHPEDCWLADTRQYVYLNMQKCGCDCTSTCTFVFLCVTLRASWVVPGARGACHIAFPAEEGAGAAVQEACW